MTRDPKSEGRKPRGGGEQDQTTQVERFWVRSNGESRKDLAKDDSARAVKSKPDGDSQDTRDVGG